MNLSKLDFEGLTFKEKVESIREAHEKDVDTIIRVRDRALALELWIKDCAP